MSRISPTNPGSTRPARAVSRAIVVQAQGDRGVLLVVDLGRAPSVVRAQRLSLAEIAEQVPSLAKGQDSCALIRVVAPESSVARAIALPAGPTESMAAAASLLGEAQLPESLPPYRRAGGVLPPPGEGAQPVAVVTGWLVRGSAPPKPLLAERSAKRAQLEEQWATPLAGLVGLLAFASREGEAQGEGVLGYVDRGVGSVSVVSRAGGQVSARVLVEDASNEDAWRAGVARAMRVGASGLILPDAPGAIVPESMRARLATALQGTGDEAWWSAFGVALGAALLRAPGMEACAPLASLRGVAPKVQEAFSTRAVRLLSRPRVAWGALAASLVLMLALPIVAAEVRHAILKGKAANLEAEQRKRSTLDFRNALYRQVDERRLPLSKLLATISAAAPEGVVCTDLTLARDQGLRLQGTAKSQQQVNELVSALNQTGMFARTNVGRSTSRAEGGFTFELSAEVADAGKPFKALDDWSERTLAVRLHGPGARNDQEPAPESKSRPDRGTRRTTGASEGPSASSIGSGKDPPAVLTDEEISKMDRSRAMREFAGRQSYINRNPQLDKATKDRLEEERRKLLERVQATKGGG